MANPFEHIQQKPETAKSLIGVSYEQFQDLVAQAEEYEKQKQEEQEKTKTRINAKGGGRPPKLSIAEKLCLCLFYLKHAVTFEVLGLLFDISQTTANDQFHYWLDFLYDLLPASLFEEMEKRGEDMEKFRQELEQYRLLVDTTEQDIERPSAQGIERKYYSGKKKSHTVKSSIITLPKGGDIVDVTTGHCEPESDISLFRKQTQKFGDNQQFDGDKGYVGEDNINTPHKKPRNRELTDEQKEKNKIFSSSRIFIEHVMRRLKIPRITQVRFPLKLSCYETVMKTVCGLVRLSLGSLKLSSFNKEEISLNQST
jgi:hypothetical protein